MVGTLQDLYAKRDELEALLEEDLEECRKSGFQYAEHEAEYRRPCGSRSWPSDARGRQ